MEEKICKYEDSQLKAALFLQQSHVVEVGMEKKCVLLAFKSKLIWFANPRFICGWQHRCPSDYVLLLWYSFGSKSMQQKWIFYGEMYTKVFKGESQWKASITYNMHTNVYSLNVISACMCVCLQFYKNGTELSCDRVDENLALNLKNLIHQLLVLVASSYLHGGKMMDFVKKYFPMWNILLPVEKPGSSVEDL